MVVRNFSIKEIHKSVLNDYLVNFQNGPEVNYTYMQGTFFIDGTTFLPIEKNTLSTSLELFTISNEKKFSNYFTTKHFDLLKNQTSNIKTLQKSFIIGNDENYYHNLILYLPKILFLINNTNLINKVDNIVFNKNLPKKFIKFIDEILKLKKIKKNLILINEKLYLFENSFCPTILGRAYKIPKNINFLEEIGNELTTGKDEINDDYQRIYVSREDSNTRKILNEDALIVFLKEHNFKIIILSKLDLLSQIKIFKKAKLIVGYHGAGLANLVFSKSPARLIEIHPNTIDDVRQHFKIISKHKNIEHSFFFVDYKSNKENSDNLTYFDGIVDIDRFRKFIKIFLDF